jgi:hypothetical protein
MIGLWVAALLTAANGQVADGPAATVAPDAPDAAAVEKADSAPVRKAAPAPQQLPVEAFARLPFIELASLSPDGLHFAGLFAIDGEQRILVSSIDFDHSKTMMFAVPDGWKWTAGIFRACSP